MRSISILLSLFWLALASIPPLQGAPLGTVFTYQGSLTDGVKPATGRFDFQFALYDDASAGSQIGPGLTRSAVAVSNGLFSASLDFGENVFTGSPRWLAIGVRDSSIAGNFSSLEPRQPLTPTPYALYASRAGSVSNLPSGQVVKSLNSLRDDVTLSAGTNVTLTPNGNGLTISAAGAGGSDIWLVQNNNTYYNAGKVGIGTAGPNGKLTVATTDDAAPTIIPAFDGRHAVVGTPTEGIGISYSANLGAGYISALAPGVEWKDMVLQGKSITFNLSGERPALSLLQNGDLRAGSLISVASDFYLGHPDRRGTPGRALVDFGGALHLNFDADWTDTVIGGRFVTAQATDFLLGHPSRRGTPGRALVDFTDTLHLNFAGDWANTFIGGNNVSVCTLTIRGGCDLAEPFPMKEEEIAKGSVVVIDEEHPGRLKLSTRAYDTQVAGIVSGANGVNPGIALYQEGVMAGGQNVALSGRVYVHADAASGPIKPGDLLTTSNTPGHAMKVTDPMKAQGAVIGKAMSALKQGKGMVLVLVTLQ